MCPHPQPAPADEVRTLPCVLDTATTQAVFDRLDRLAGCRRLRLDLGRVEYLTAAALGRLAALAGRVRVAGGELVVCNARGEVRRVLDMTRLSGLLGIPQEVEGVARR
jgi:anti-anti-sigma factor